MQLVVRQNGGNANKLRFMTGPVHLGRGVDSQVFLLDGKVSRHHAVIFTTPDGDWMVQDLDSANKTYLNDNPIHKAKIKTGDRIRIAGFTIEIDVDSEAAGDKPAGPEDTLTAVPRKLQVITRDLNADHAPDIKIPAQRARDFLEATEDICKANGLDQVLQILLTIMFRQFDALHCWCALRIEPSGPMISHTGKTLNGAELGLGDIMLNEKITYAVENSLFLLFPSVSTAGPSGGIRSAIIAPILDPDGCFGAIYVDNAADSAAYSLSDLDYLMLLAIHTAAIVENF